MSRSCSTLAPVLCGLALVAGCATSRADPGYYVVTVYDNPGVRTLDLRFWDTRLRGRQRVQWPELGLGWNVTGRWYTEVLASWIGSSQSATRLSTVNWQNDVLLTQGQWPVDIAMHTLYVRSSPSSAGSLFEFGPALQTDIGRTQLNGNVFLERSVGRGPHGPTQVKYQWQVRHRWQPWLHVGAQGFGEPGRWDRWAPHSAQSHRAGPALFGSLRTDAATVGWQAAWLHGKVYGRRGNMFTARMKIEF